MTVVKSKSQLSYLIAIDPNNYEIIVVDNGSGKDSQDFLDEIEGQVKVIRNDKNLYWSAAANKGVAAADKASKYLVFMHPDVVVLNPAWLDLLINVSESQSSHFVGVDQLAYYMQNQKIEFIQEWLLLVTRQGWKDIGPWPEELPQIGHSFILTLRAQSKGLKPQVMRNPIAHHYRVFSLDVNTYEMMIERALSQLPKYIRETQTTAV